MSLAKIGQRIENVRSRLLCRPQFTAERSEEYLTRFVRSRWIEYELWLYRHRLFSRQSLLNNYKQVRAFHRKPVVSILMPVHNPDPEEFRQTMLSLLWQIYPHWQLCLVDDGSSDHHYMKYVRSFLDKRIKVHVQSKCSGIAHTTREALAMADGDYVAFLDQDDELTPDALFAFVSALQEDDIDFFYSDRDMISPSGDRHMHFMKPDWSPEYQLSFNYTAHLEIYSTTLVRSVDAFQQEHEGSQDFDLALRVTEQTKRIFHHPMVLYGWRQSAASIAVNNDRKEYVYDAGVKAVQAACRRRNLPVGRVSERTDVWRGHYRLEWSLDKLRKHRVFFVLVGSESQRQTLQSLINAFANEIDEVHIVSVEHTLSVDLFNKCREQDILIFCDSSLVNVDDLGLGEVLGYLSIDGVEVVGGKCLDDQNTIVSAGIAFTPSNKPLLCYRGAQDTVSSYGAVTAVPRNVAVVQPAFWAASYCSLRNRGFAVKEQNYYLASLIFFKDVYVAGGRTVLNPLIRCVVENKESEFQAALEQFQALWRQEGLVDKYYNPHLTDACEDFGLQV